MADKGKVDDDDVGVDDDGVKGDEAARAEDLMRECFGDSDASDDDIDDDVVKLSDSEDEGRGEEEEEEEESEESESDDEVAPVHKKKKKEKKEKKKKEKKSEKKTPRKKSVRKEGGNAGGSSAGTASVGRPKKAKTPKKTPAELAELHQKMALALVNKMNIEADNDEDAVRAGRPAIHKLQVREEVLLGLRKVKLWQYLLDEHVLEAIYRWMRPSGPHDIPDINLRTDFLRILLTLPVEKDHLTETNICRLIAAIWRAPQEAPENRSLASQIISKWMNLTLGIDSYKSMHFEGEKEPIIPRKRRRSDGPDPEEAWMRRLKETKEDKYVRHRHVVSDLNFRAFPPKNHVPSDDEAPHRPTKRRFVIKKGVKAT